MAAGICEGTKRSTNADKKIKRGGGILDQRPRPEKRYGVKNIFYFTCLLRWSVAGPALPLGSRRDPLVWLLIASLCE